MTSRGKNVSGTADVIVIGAGHSGLAISHFLRARSIQHVVLERGEVANSWRRERWDSLRLLTPNWMTRLPGFAYAGDDPDGFMSSGEVADFISNYAAWIDSPVVTGASVTAVRQSGSGYRVETGRGIWRGRAVVLATGACNRAAVPAIAAGLPAGVQQFNALDYRNPSALPEGGVLVVGASATGVQIADELHRSGRPATLAIGEHVRMPRRYRGRDIQWWLLACGILDEGLQDVDDLRRVRRLPSPQLVGTPDHRTLDLNALRRSGVRLVGRLAGARGQTLQFSGSLRNVCALADLKMNRMLNTIDEWIDAQDMAGEVAAPERFEATAVQPSPALTLDLEREGIRSVVWATGYRPEYGWLEVPVLDRKGQLRHDGGVVDAPGLYAIGLPFLRRRKSSFIHGAEADAADLVQHIAGYLAGARQGVAV